MWFTFKISIALILISISTAQLLCHDIDSDSSIVAPINEDEVIKLYNLGWEKIEKQQRQQAIEYFQEARNLVLTWPVTDYSWIVDINEALAGSLSEIGKYRNALELFYENLTLCDLLVDSLKWMCKTIANSTIGICYSKMGLQPLASDYFLKSVLIDSEYFPERNDFHFGNYHSLAYINSLMGNYQLAENYFKKTLDKINYPEIYNPYLHQMLLLQLTQLYLHWNQLEEAEKLYLQFLKKNKITPFVSEGLIFQTEIGILYYYKIGDFENALNVLYEGKKLIENIHQLDPHFHCRMYSSAANLLIKMNKHTEARNLLNICTHLLKPFSSIPSEDIEDIESLLKARELYNKSLLVEALNSDMDQIQKENILIEVYQNIEALADLLEHHLSSVFIPLTKNKIVQKFMPIFEIGIWALYELSLISDAEVWTKKAILFADRSRAVLLIEHLMYKLTGDSRVPDIIQKDNIIKQQYDSIFFQMISLKDNQLKDENIERDYLIALASLRLEREQLFRSELRNERNYIRDMLGGSRVQENFFEDIIKNNISLLTHFFGQNNMYTFALSSNGYSFEKKELKQDLLEKAILYRQEIEKFPEVFGIHESYLQHLNTLNKLNQEIFEYFIGDAIKILTDYLLFIAVDEASVIPIAALKNNQAGSLETPYLVQQCKIFKTYSLKNLELQYKNPRLSSSNKFIAFAPEYNYDNISLPGINYQFSLLPLTFNKKEVKWLQQHMGTQIYLNENATLENFINEIPETKVLHLSGHAYAHDQHPELSFFAFSPRDNTEGYNHLLRLVDIEKMEIPVNLVFLNGCQTGYGRILSGEGPESVHRAFAIAGTSSLINTLWPINDHTGMEVTKRFYKELEKGKDIPTALRYAQLQLIESNHPVYSHPYFWSGYTSYGVPDNPFMSTKTSSNLLLFITGLILMIIYFLWNKNNATVE